MQRLVFILIFIFASTWSHADPGKRLTREERQLAKDERQIARIERKYARKNVPWDEREKNQKQNDRMAMVFVVITAAMVLAAMGKTENP